MNLEFNRNEDVMKRALSEMKQRFAQVALGGGKKAIAKQPIVYNNKEGVNANNKPERVKHVNTIIKILKELNLSPSQPPIGLIAVANTINPAVLIPASTLSNSK